MYKSGKNRGLTRRSMNDAKRGLILNSPTKENSPNATTEVVESVSKPAKQEVVVQQIAPVSDSTTELKVSELSQKLSTLESEIMQLQKLKLTLEAGKAQVELEKLAIQEELQKVTLDKQQSSEQVQALKKNVGVLEQDHASLNEKYERLTAEYTFLESQHTHLQTELKEVSSARFSLESRLETLQVDNAALVSNLNALTAKFNTTETSLKQQISSLQDSLLEEQTKHQSFVTQQQQTLEQERKKFTIIAQEHEALKKDNDSKTRKLERLEEFVSITKEMNTGLQVERDQLKEQLANEKETSSKLHALVQASHSDTSSLEKQVEQAENQIKSAASQLYKVHCTLFFNTGLALKLDRLHSYGQICNISLQKLWEDVQTLGVDPQQWSVFINAALSAAAKDSETCLVIN